MSSYIVVGVEILWWLAPAVVVTVLAMAWVGWVGRDLDPQDEKAKEKAQQKLAEAILREHPGQVLTRRKPADRSTGIAVRSSRSSRRSA